MILNIRLLVFALLFPIGLMANSPKIITSTNLEFDNKSILKAAKSLPGTILIIEREVKCIDCYIKALELTNQLHIKPFVLYSKYKIPAQKFISEHQLLDLGYTYKQYSYQYKVNDTAFYFHLPVKNSNPDLVLLKYNKASKRFNYIFLNFDKLFSNNGKMVLTKEDIKSYIDLMNK